MKYLFLWVSNAIACSSRTSLLGIFLPLRSEGSQPRLIPCCLRPRYSHILLVFPHVHTASSFFWQPAEPSTLAQLSLFSVVKERITAAEDSDVF
jgi:hypothetical protein